MDKLDNSVYHCPLAKDKVRTDNQPATSNTWSNGWHQQNDSAHILKLHLRGAQPPQLDLTHQLRQLHGKRSTNPHNKLGHIAKCIHLVFHLLMHQYASIAIALGDNMTFLPNSFRELQAIVLSLCIGKFSCLASKLACHISFATKKTPADPALNMPTLWHAT